MMATTLSETITSCQGSTVGPLIATAFITINNLGPDPGPLIVSWGGVAPPDSILVSGSVTVNAAEDNTGLWPLIQNSALLISGPVGQSFSLYYA
jgi:hypothetical protein